MSTPTVSQKLSLDSYTNTILQDIKNRRIEGGRLNLLVAGGEAAIAVPLASGVDALVQVWRASGGCKLPNRNACRLVTPAQHLTKAFALSGHALMSSALSGVTLFWPELAEKSAVLFGVKVDPKEFELGFFGRVKGSICNVFRQGKYVVTHPRTLLALKIGGSAAMIAGALLALRAGGPLEPPVEPDVGFGLLGTALSVAGVFGVIVVGVHVVRNGFPSLPAGGFSLSLPRFASSSSTSSSTSSAPSKKWSERCSDFGITCRGGLSGLGTSAGNAISGITSALSTRVNGLVSILPSFPFSRGAKASDSSSSSTSSELASKKEEEDTSSEFTSEGNGDTANNLTSSSSGCMEGSGDIPSKSAPPSVSSSSLSPAPQLLDEIKPSSPDDLDDFMELSDSRSKPVSTSPSAPEPQTSYFGGLWGVVTWLNPRNWWSSSVPASSPSIPSSDHLNDSGSDGEGDTGKSSVPQGSPSSSSSSSTSSPPHTPPPPPPPPVRLPFSFSSSSSSVAAADPAWLSILEKFELVRGAYESLSPAALETLSSSQKGKTSFEDLFKAFDAASNPSSETKRLVDLTNKCLRSLEPLATSSEFAVLVSTLKNLEDALAPRKGGSPEKKRE